MTKRELAAFTLKLLGVYAIIRSLPFLQHIFGIMFEIHGYDQTEIVRRFFMSMISLFPFVLTAGAGVLLFICNRYLASVIVKEDGDMKLSTSLDSDDIQGIGFSVAAVIIFLLAIPRLAYLILFLSYALLISVNDGERLSYIRSAWQSGLSFALQCGLAIVLFFRARGLVNIWRRIQVGKYAKIEDA